MIMRIWIWKRVTCFWNSFLLLLPSVDATDSRLGEYHCGDLDLADVELFTHLDPFDQRQHLLPVPWEPSLRYRPMALHEAERQQRALVWGPTSPFESLSQATEQTSS